MIRRIMTTLVVASLCLVMYEVGRQQGVQQASAKMHQTLDEYEYLDTNAIVRVPRPVVQTCTFMTHEQPCNDCPGWQPPTK